MGLKRGVIISIELQLVAVEVDLDATALIFLFIVGTFWCKSLKLDCFTAT